MTKYWYQCTNCGIAVKNDSPPSAARCVKGATHNWHKLGEVGSTTFTCGKCETTIKTESIPDSDGCLSGGLHSWYKL